MLALRIKLNLTVDEKTLILKLIGDYEAIEIILGKILFFFKMYAVAADVFV